MANHLISSADWWQLASLTGDKICHEAERKEPNLRRLVLLCNTYDARESFCRPNTTTFLASDGSFPSSPGVCDEDDELPPPYESYCSPNVEVKVAEWDLSTSTNSDSDSDSDSDWDDGSTVPVEVYYDQAALNQPSLDDDLHSLHLCQSTFILPENNQMGSSGASLNRGHWETAHSSIATTKYESRRGISKVIQVNATPKSEVRLVTAFYEPRKLSKTRHAPNSLFALLRTVVS